VPARPQKGRALEEAEIRKVEAETAEIEARTFHIRVRTALIAIAVVLVLVHLFSAGAIVPEHGDLIGRLLP
jgi:hypothetical protein